jgi:hypothetical protein
MARRLSWGVLLVLAGCGSMMGCSSIVSPDLDRLGGSDGGSSPTLDAGPGVDGGPNVRVDSGPMPRVDAGPRDGGPPRVDAGPSCSGPPRCEGEVLVECVAGEELRELCTDFDSFCAEGECREWICEPGSIQCSDDLRAVETCSERGDAVRRDACERGCNPATDACITVSPTCMGLPTLAVGTSTTIDLCRQANTTTHRSAEGCPTTQLANVGDRTFVLTIETATNVVIELTDVDSGAAIDTIVYVRRVCDDAETQLVCSDDVACTSSTVPGPGGCSGSVDVRQSRIRTRLEPGVHYVVADAFAYSTERNTYRCGQVRLSVRTG